MEGLIPGSESADRDLLAASAQESARTVAALERVALGAVASCAVAAAVALFAFPGTAHREPPEALRAAGTAIPFLAMILILVASRVRGVMLRAARRLALLSSPSGSELARAYWRANLLDLVLLELVAWLGVAMVPLTGSIRYALVMIVAAAVGMAVRWPRRSELDALAR